MVVYQLACSLGHTFEGWYASPEAFDRQSEGGYIDCPSCGNFDVRKLPSAPYVKTGNSSRPPEGASEGPGVEHQLALQALRTFLVTNTENVGRDFAEMARRIHYGEMQHRAIRGQVTSEEAEALREEGVPAYPISPDISLDEIH